MSTQHTPGSWTHVPGGFTIKAPSEHLSFQLVASLLTGMKTRSEVDANARLIAAAPELLAELRSAHQVIRHALAVMTVEQKAEWGRKNAAAGVEGEGITRANEREAVITKAGGAA